MGLHIRDMEAFVAKRRFQEIHTDLSILKDRLFGMGLPDEARKVKLLMDEMRLKGEYEIRKIEDRESHKGLNTNPGSGTPEDHQSPESPKN